ncbi:hypothetical protein Srubr_04530 [Streptomyces rubradiris]|uniref:Uncharacterized protein n=1 Tax=Streptomyces rubradiris TaxID=285531 RepID=A0ABQ3R415_STRRR|nr:hypothetical protein GCM10018792_23590 [Streptomyces rubradiris]GHI50607.1 hypothetical protein Srubr_04530 [Streptomyces rubradiris]
MSFRVQPLYVRLPGGAGGAWLSTMSVTALPSSCAAPGRAGPVAGKAGAVVLPRGFPVFKNSVPAQGDNRHRAVGD